MSKIVKPKISKNISSKSINDHINIDEFIDLSFNDEKLNHEIEYTEINGCIFKNVDFSKFALKNIDLIDCIFDSCDLSNIDINSKLFLRVEFINCSLVGANLVDVVMKSVKFKSCNMEYVNLSSKCKDVLFDGSKIKNGRFFECKFNTTEINGCDLSNAEFFSSKLEGMDLSNSKLDDIKSDYISIKGCTVDMGGLLELSKILGVNVKF